MRLTDLLEPDSVVVDLAVSSRHGLFEALARLLAPRHALAVLEALSEREQLGSTALGGGVALPHGRCPALTAPAAACVRLARRLDLGALDGQPVDLVIALVTPDHFTAGHLALLADVAGHCADPARLTALRTAPDASALRAELAKWPADPP